MTVESSVDKAGGRVDQQAKTAKARLAFDTRDEVIGDTDSFEGSPEYELARVQQKDPVGCDFDLLGEKAHVLFHVDDAGRMVAEDAEETVEFHVDGRWLNAGFIQRIENDATLGQLFPKGSIRKDHTADDTCVVTCDEKGMMNSVCIIANPAAGDGSAATVSVAIVAAAVEAGHNVTLVTPDSEAGTSAALRHALHTHVERVIVVGGDGIVHLAVNVLATTGVVLGIVPIGTGNDGARALGLPLNTTAAIAAALGPAVDVDGLRTSHGWALTVATAGFGVEVNKRANRLRWPRGAARYKRATLEALPGLQPLPLVLTVDGVQHDVSVTLIAVGNGAYFGGNMLICPAASPMDGQLDVTVVGPLRRLELLRFFPTVYDGSHLSNPKVQTYRGRVITLDGVAELWADGEPLGPLPATLEAVPGALRIAGVSR